MRVRQLVALSLCLVLLGSSAHAATPTPKPSSKPSPSKKATVKPSSKPSSSKKATVKPTGKSTVKSDSTKKPVKKKATKKPTKKKKKVKKTATPIPSPSPIWPPVRFTSNKGIYAKIPTGKELVGLISAKRKLAADVVKCSTNACGAVIVAADYSCKWWEIKSTVSGNDPNDPSKKILLGTLRTTYGSLNPNTYANILLISDEPLFMPETLDPITLTPMPPIPRPGIVVGNISATCHKSSANEKIPTNTYLPIRR
ncbi:MAG: hypothetical protein ABR73_03775 [Actinobacteria bacterium BACL4 MAG-121001-bin59]|jgi:hypothetical protein|uniref:hypothetical protein n=1 Tax=Candidatus Nanopelagicus sp. TaxID=2518620 RepID=UPI000714EBC2|nr:MAG: hypothetical protein ABR73_03775 [Actinobacteria bacterium BACL4 MAG-121001-bin59]